MRTIIEMIISCHSFIFKKRDKDPEKPSDFLKFSQKDSDKVLHLHLCAPIQCSFQDTTLPDYSHLIFTSFSDPIYRFKKCLKALSLSNL